MDSPATAYFWSPLILIPRVAGVLFNILALKLAIDWQHQIGTQTTIINGLVYIYTIWVLSYQSMLAYSEIEVVDEETQLEDAIVETFVVVFLLGLIPLILNLRTYSKLVHKTSLPALYIFLTGCWLLFGHFSVL